MPAASLRRVRRRGEEAVRGQVRAPGVLLVLAGAAQVGGGWRGGNVSELPQARAQAAADEDVLHVKREVGEPGRDAGARGGGGEGSGDAGGLSGWKSCESGRTRISTNHHRVTRGTCVGFESGTKNRRENLVHRPCLKSFFQTKNLATIGDKANNSSVALEGLRRRVITRARRTNGRESDRRGEAWEEDGAGSRDGSRARTHTSHAASR